MESFKTFTKYKYPILSPKRSSLERAKAGILDFPNTPTRLDTTWEPGMLNRMRADSRCSSPARTAKNRSGLGRTQTIQSKQGVKELALFSQDMSLMSASIPTTNPLNERTGSKEKPNGNEKQDLNATMNDRDLSMVGIREDQPSNNKNGQSTRESNFDLADGGIENNKLKNQEI